MEGTRTLPRHAAVDFFRRHARPVPEHHSRQHLSPGNGGEADCLTRDFGSRSGTASPNYFLPPLAAGGALVSAFFALGFLSSFTFFTPAFFSAFLAAN